MVDKKTIIKQVQGALEYEPRVNLHSHPLKVDVVEGAIVLEGEVESVAAKKLALERAGAIEGPRGVVDRLRVAPLEQRGDGAMRDTLCNLLLQQPELRNCTIRARAKGRVKTLREAGAEGSGAIEIEIENGVIALEGTVISLSHMRLAGVLAWWTPGCRDVVNSLEVQPPQRDSDEEVVDALRLVLEADPLVRAESIAVGCESYVVTLEGRVRTQSERRRVELDAFALFAVDDVINRLEVRP